MSKEQAQVRVQDDLYGYVNGEWMKTAVIPNDKPFTGGFITLSDDIEKLLMEDFKKFANGEKETEITPVGDAVRLYRKALDVRARASAGMQPLVPLLEKIRGLKDMADLNAQLTAFVSDDLPLPFTVEVMEDPRNTDRQCFALMDPEIILPDTTYYDKPIPKFYMLSIWRKMAASLLKLSPLDRKEQKEYLRDTIRFDDLLRKKALSSREMADYVKLLNSMDTEEAARLMAPLELKGLLDQL